MSRTGDWALEANCAGADPDMFFPRKGESAMPAVKVCAQCPVKRECQEHALKAEEKFGIWGGMTEQARKINRRGRRRFYGRGDKKIVPDNRTF